ncbi:50S ribosomal protein L32 [Actinobacteria bacterium YIM 96077]|uniref:Large ribosomal subunit protein bL32 n=1 Tax=Phytoactinopolyspora halophila TaxID=1981511 RepID=A0A329QE11_9ACTN|nr:50S ribosomal protein L32 [Phytoactinopolyspora halophila]AYY12706.1 50S ribosomal protein L32 [Actinobacteria bacterium YIM 96077]RAW10620.1 50S ribosomal protein L32 [Phytoactinopolyspora halophila]
MAVPKQKKSRSNTRHRRAQWKMKLPQLQRRTVNGKTTWVVPHRAHVVEDSQGTPLYREYNGRQVGDA